MQEFLTVDLLAIKANSTYLCLLSVSCTCFKNFGYLLAFSARKILVNTTNYIKNNLSFFHTCLKCTAQIA